MERSDSYWFFTLLNLYKKRLKYEHHRCFLQICEEKQLIATGLRLRKNANIASVRALFVTDWQHILAEASHRLQRLLEQETELIVKKNMKEIRKVESSISHEYGPWRSQVLIRKVQEVSGRFEGNLMQRRSRKLDAISVVNDAATVIEDEQFEGDGDNGLELRIHNFVSDIRRTVDVGLTAWIIFKASTVKLPSILLLFTASLSLESPSFAVAGVLKSTSKETITLPLL